MKTCNRRYEALVSAVVSRELGTACTLEPIPTYPDTIVYEISAPSVRAVFKAIDPDGRDADGVALEAWTCERARLAGVPAPRVLAVDTTKARFPGSFFIMEKATGAPLERMALPDAQMDVLLAELGSHLRALHDVRISGFGWLDEEAFRSSRSVRGWADTWRLALMDGVHESLEYLSATGLSSAEVAAARNAVDAGVTAVAGFTDGRLLHGDVGLLHVWAEPSEQRITSLVDFGERSAGDPASDFGDIEGRHLQAVLTGYGPEDTDDFKNSITFYALIRAIPWAHKWHSRGEPKVLDWVRHVLQNASTT